MDIDIFKCFNGNSWIVKLDGVDGTLYAGKSYRLQFKFGQMYPMESPEVNINSQQEKTTF